MSTEPDKTPSRLALLEDAYEPTSSDAERVFAKLQASMGQVASSAPSVPAAALKQSRAGWLLGWSCAAFVFVGAVIVSTRGDRPTPPAAETGAAVRVAENAPPAKEAAPSSETTMHEPIAVPSIAVDSLPTAVADAPQVRIAKRPAPTVTPPSTSPSPAPTENDTLAREARLLAEAGRANQNGDGARALALLDEHAQTFPNGWLANERAAERIVVLCSLGRRAEAVREAAVFLDGRPKSPLTRRVELSCAGQP